MYRIAASLLTLSAVLALGDGMDKDVATDPELWAFRPVQRPQVPAVMDEHWSRNDLDRFVLAGMESKGLSPSPPADRETLLRRVCFDLTGLPPTESRRRDFLADTSPGAWDRLIDRLLASPAYGERWGRHWLDLARYADTSGDATDMPVPEAAKYRDYVIAAFNEDLPYDEFIREQLAGDLLDGDARWRQRRLATGYIALAQRFGNSKYADMHLVIENTIDTIGQGMLGMTLRCARCHDHKFDPVSQRDYYALYGYFESTRYPHAGTEHARYREHFVPLESDPAKMAAFEAHEAKVAKLSDDLKRTERSRRKDRGDAELKAREEKLKRELKALQAKRPALELAWAVCDAEETGDARLQRGGDPDSKQDLVPRGFLSAIADRPADVPEGRSGRRQLAEWIASPDNALTARVMVNRIWLHHFGRGLVATPNVFGSKGVPPTHPELLDWLASEFVARGWSIKDMHRLMLRSATYRQASALRPEQAERDPDNTWWWRMDRRRLDGEQIRDAILAVSGTLVEGPAKPHPFPAEAHKKYSQGNPFKDDYSNPHRTVYQMTRRNGHDDYWSLFDAPDRSQPTGQRVASTVSMQALFLMNSGFAQREAAAFAQRVGAVPEPRDRLAKTWRLAYGREPSDEERGDALAHAEAQGWTSLCRAVLASNEFIYLD